MSVVVVVKGGPRGIKDSLNSKNIYLLGIRVWRLKMVSGDGHNGFTGDGRAKSGPLPLWAAVLLLFIATSMATWDACLVGLVIGSPPSMRY